MGQQVTTIKNKAEYQSVLKHLDQDKKPSFILRLLMNALESYRQARKMGWSRPQNKYGMTIFNSFRLEREKDQSLIDSVIKNFLAEFPDLDEESSQYVRDLHQDPHLMGFVFFHDFHEEETLYEGMTFSLGRLAPGRSSHRDRFDLILESEVKNGFSQGVTRIRAYVDPFKLPIKKNPALFLSNQTPRTGGVKELFLEGTERYQQWLGDADRVWEHWTQRYINYFGPRTLQVNNSYFPSLVDFPADQEVAEAS